MYIIKKTFNNNIALVEDESHQEYILLGTGLAFQKKAGDKIDEDKIDKRFTLDSSELQTRFNQLLTETPIIYFELTVRVVKQAEKELGVSLNPMIYVGLSDHLRYAIDRARQGIEMPNAMLWEIRRFYPDEYQAALNALELIYYYEKIWLSEKEAGYIALHLVNARSHSPEMKLTIELTSIIMDIMKITQLFFKVELDETSLSYNRFATHISFLIRRIAQGELSKSEESFIYNQMSLAYPQSLKCAMQISDYLNIKMGITLTKDELVYFMIHLNRIVEHSLQ